eukprot:179012-Pleurochrysis_carterae.AAC.9
MSLSGAAVSADSSARYTAASHHTHLWHIDMSVSHLTAQAQRAPARAHQKRRRRSLTGKGAFE